MAQGVNEQIGAITAIKAKAHLVQVGLQVLGAEAMPRSDDAALQERKCGLDGIGVNVGSDANIFLRAVVDGFMPRLADRLAIGAVFVGHDYVNVFGDIVLNELRQRATLGVFRVEETHRAAALTNAENNLLIAVSETRLAMTLLMSTNIGFVHFDSTVQQGPLRLDHGATDAVAEIPCCLVTDSDSALHLVRRESLASLTEQMCGDEPLEQRQMGVVEDRASGDGELVIAVLAVEQLRAESRQFPRPATWALGAKGPTQPLQELPTAVIGIKCGSNVEESHSEYPR